MSKAGSVPLRMMLMSLTVCPAAIVTTPGEVSLAGPPSFADSLVSQYSSGPGNGRGGLIGPILPPLIWRISTVYWPGGTGNSKKPMRDGSRDPNRLPPELFASVPPPQAVAGTHGR